MKERLPGAILLCTEGRAKWPGMKIVSERNKYSAKVIDVLENNFDVHRRSAPSAQFYGGYQFRIWPITSPYVPELRRWVMQSVSAKQNNVTMEPTFHLMDETCHHFMLFNTSLFVCLFVCIKILAKNVFSQPKSNQPFCPNECFTLTSCIHKYEIDG